MNIINKILAWSKANPWLAVGSIAACWFILNMWKNEREASHPNNAARPDPETANPNP